MSQEQIQILLERINEEVAQNFGDFFDALSAIDRCYEADDIVGLLNIGKWAARQKRRAANGNGNGYYGFRFLSREAGDSAARIIRLIRRAQAI